MSKVPQILRRQRHLRSTTKTTAEALLKEDVPAVQAEIELLAPLVAEVWRRGAEAALREAAAQAALRASLRAQRDREFTQDQIVAILGSLYIAFGQEALDAIVVLEAARRLVEAGWRSTGETYTGLDAGQILLVENVRDDLQFWVTERFRERQEALEPILEEWLLLDPEDREDAIEDMLEGVEAVVDDPSGVTAAFLTDLWAYRSFNAAIVLAAVRAGHELLELFNNPAGGGPDQKTTTFCRSIHGRRFNVRALWFDLTRYYREVEKRDGDSAKAVLPLLSSQEAGRAADEAALAALGPPPYHGRCRTILRVIRRR